MAQDTLGIITPHPPIMVPEVGGERAGVTRASSEAMATAARIAICGAAKPPRSPPTCAAVSTRNASAAVGA